MLDGAGAVVGPACSARRADGSACRATAGPDGKCFAHSPALRAKAQAARTKGGQNRATSARLGKLVPERLQAIYNLLEEVLNELHKGTVTPQVGGAMAHVASALIKLATAGEIELRLRRLEEQQANSNEKRR